MTKTAIRSAIAIVFCSSLLIAMSPSLHKSSESSKRPLSQVYSTDSAGYTGAIKSSVGSLSWLVTVNGISNADQNLAG